MLTIDQLKEELPEICARYRIVYVDVFGSMARNEQTPESDIDLIIELEEPRREAISDRFFGFLHSIEDRSHQKVDLLTESSLKNPYLIKKVNKDRVRLYG